MFEIGCNVGNVILLLAEHFPTSTFYGIDIDDGAIEKAKSLANEKHLNNALFSFQDATELPPDWSDSFDYAISYKAIHDIPLATKALREIRRCLKLDGYFSILEYNISSNVTKNRDHKLAGILYGSGIYNCIPCAMHPEGGMGLGACWGKEAISKCLQGVGFSNVSQVDDAQPLVHFLARK